MGKIAIYTCMTGGYDIPTDGFEHVDGYDYFLFSDVPVNTKSWNNITVQFNMKSELNSIKKQRMIKTHPHVFLKDYDLVVYIDANTSVDSRLYKYIDENKDNIITFKNHPDRDCVYDEIDICMIVGKETREIGEGIKKRYKEEGYPRHQGLFETNIIVSHPKDEKVRSLFEKWWMEIYRNSHRDQFSLNYVIWKNHLEDIITAKTSSDFKPKFHTRMQNR